MTTLLFVLLLFLAISGILVWVKTPRYRLQSDNVVALLTLVLSGQAHPNDWQVFIAMPLHYDEQLEVWRQRCIEIDDNHYTENTNQPFLFDRQGLDQLQELLQEIQACLSK